MLDTGREDHDRSLDEWRDRAMGEVWCANDERPAVTNRLVRDGRTGKIERRALCGDCNWLALAARMVQPQRVTVRP